MKLTALVVAATLAALWSTSVHSQSPRHFTFAAVTSGDDIQIGYVNTGTIKVVGTKRTAWVLWVPLETRKVGDKTLSHVLRQSEYDCANSTIKLRYLAAYDTKGSLLLGQASPSYEPADPVIPGSTGEDTLAMVCEGEALPGYGELDLNAAIADARSGKYSGIE